MKKKHGDQTVQSSHKTDLCFFCSLFQNRVLHQLKLVNVSILDQNLSVLPLLPSIHEILLIKPQKAVAYPSTKRTLCLITVSSRTSYPRTVLGNEVQSLKSYNPLSFKLLSRVLKPCL